MMNKDKYGLALYVQLALQKQILMDLIQYEMAQLDSLMLMLLFQGNFRSCMVFW